MSKIKGITVILHEKVYAGKDAFNHEIFEETTVEVENVLVAPANELDNGLVDATMLSGKKALYQLGIPKGDTHNWEDCTVEFFGHKWKSTGFSAVGIDHLIPLDWNRKVLVERYG